MNNIFHDDVQKFIQIRDNFGNITLNFTEKNLLVWRNLFKSYHWSVDKPLESDIRKQFNQLNPQFVLEDEGLIFYANIRTRYYYARVMNIHYEDISLNSGYLLAAESRLIFGNPNQNTINQILYKNIRAVYHEQNKITLSLSNDIEANIQLKLMGSLMSSALVGILLGLIFPSAGENWSRGQTRDTGDAIFFRDQIIGFFNEIADENRRMRKSQY